jgi:hypothetical protein
MSYAKSMVAVVATIASAIVAGLTGDSVISDVEWINVAIAGATALAVFTAPNTEFARITKFSLAFIMAALTLAVNLIVDGLTVSEWLQLLVAGLGAVGVYAVRNGPVTAE